MQKLEKKFDRKRELERENEFSLVVVLLQKNVLDGEGVWESVPVVCVVFPFFIEWILGVDFANILRTV